MTDREYHINRASQEREQAAKSADEYIARQHLALAALHDDKAFATDAEAKESPSASA